MSGSLSEMRAQRNALDAQIREAEARQSEDWNTALEDLYQNLHTYVADHNLTVDDSTRKNVYIVTVDSRVTVEFGYDDGEHSCFLAASDTLGTRVEMDPTQVGNYRFFAIIETLLGGRTRCQAEGCAAPETTTEQQ